MKRYQKDGPRSHRDSPLSINEKLEQVQKRVPSKPEAQICELYKKYPNGEFTAKEIEESLALSKTTIHRRLKTYVDCGVLRISLSNRKYRTAVYYLNEDMYWFIELRIEERTFHEQDVLEA